MKREKTRAILIVLVFGLMCFIWGCQIRATSPEEPTATPIFIPTATNTPVSTPTPTPTYTPIRTATPTTTPTPRPTNTPTPTPTPSVVIYERAPIFNIGVVVDTSARRIPETEIRQLFDEAADLFRDRALPAISVQTIEYINREEAVVNADVPPKSDHVLMLIYLLKHQQNPPDAIVIFSRSSIQLSEQDATRYGISTPGAYNIRPLGISNYTSRFRSPNYSDSIYASLIDLDVSYIKERGSWYLAHELLHPFGIDFFKINLATNKIDMDADHYDHPKCAGRMPGIVPRGDARFLDEYIGNFGFCPDVLTNFRKSPFGEQRLAQQQVGTPTPTPVPVMPTKGSIIAAYQTIVGRNAATDEIYRWLNIPDAIEGIANSPEAQAFKARYPNPEAAPNQVMTWRTREEIFQRIPFTEEAKEIIRRLQLEVDDCHPKNRMVGGGGEWHNQKNLVHLTNCNNGNMIHEFVHVVADSTGFYKDGPGRNLAFRRAFQQLADEYLGGNLLPIYQTAGRKAAELAYGRNSVEGNPWADLNIDIRNNEVEPYAELAAVVGGDMKMLPFYIREFYANVFRSS